MSITATATDIALVVRDSRVVLERAVAAMGARRRAEVEVLAVGRD